MKFIGTARRTHTVINLPQTSRDLQAHRGTSRHLSATRITNRCHDSRHIEAPNSTPANAPNPRRSTIFGFLRNIVSIKKPQGNCFKSQQASGASIEGASRLTTPIRSFVRAPQSETRRQSIHTAIQRANTEIYRNRSPEDLLSAMREMQSFLDSPDAIDRDLVILLREKIKICTAELPKMIKENNDALLNQTLPDRTSELNGKSRVESICLSLVDVKAMDDLEIHLNIADVVLETRDRDKQSKGIRPEVANHNLRMLLTEAKKRPLLVQNSHLLNQAQAAIDRLDTMRKSPSTRHEFKPPRNVPDLDAVRSNTVRRKIDERPGTEHKAPDLIYATLDWTHRPDAPFVRPEKDATEPTYVTIQHIDRGTQ
jgi:hypothetical protein